MYEKVDLIKRRAEIEHIRELLYNEQSVIEKRLNFLDKEYKAIVLLLELHKDDDDYATKM